MWATRVQQLLVSRCQQVAVGRYVSGSFRAPEWATHARTSYTRTKCFQQQSRGLAYHATENTLYDLLGVSQTASSQEIKAAFLLRAKELHPDARAADAKGDNLDADAFVRLVTAREV